MTTDPTAAGCIDQTDADTRRERRTVSWCAAGLWLTGPMAIATYLAVLTIWPRSYEGWSGIFLLLALVGHVLGPVLWIVLLRRSVWFRTHALLWLYPAYLLALVTSVPFGLEALVVTVCVASLAMPIAMAWHLVRR
ncbi:MAG: hypothetical protein H6838_17805 [Planctomycetes bacterium]|nr:hypothetical protein [Planctomycetota bacterium]